MQNKKYNWLDFFVHLHVTLHKINYCFILRQPSIKFWSMANRTYNDPLYKKRPEAIFWITSLDWHCFQNNTKGDVDVETKYDGRQLLKSQNPDRQKIQVNLAKWARRVLFAIFYAMATVWKCKIFYVSQILREINFGKLKAAELAERKFKLWIHQNWFHGKCGWQEIFWFYILGKIR